MDARSETDAEEPEETMTPFERGSALINQGFFVLAEHYGVEVLVSVFGRALINAVQAGRAIEKERFGVH